MRDVTKDRHTWIMSLLYIGTFGSFIGFGFAFGQVLQVQFADTFTTPVKAAYLTFLGPLLGSLIRPFGGALADRLGGARVTFVNFVAMAVGAVGRAARRAATVAAAVPGRLHRAVRVQRHRQRLDVQDDPGDLPGQGATKISDGADLEVAADGVAAAVRRADRHRRRDRRVRRRAGQPGLPAVVPATKTRTRPTRFIAFYAVCFVVTYFVYIRKSEHLAGRRLSARRRGDRSGRSGRSAAAAPVPRRPPRRGGRRGPVAWRKIRSALERSQRASSSRLTPATTLVDAAAEGAIEWVAARLRAPATWMVRGSPSRPPATPRPTTPSRPRPRICGCSACGRPPAPPRGTAPGRPQCCGAARPWSACRRPTPPIRAARWPSGTRSGWHWTAGELPLRRHRGGRGRVTLVGGGPGDAELLTLRGRRALAEADVVVVDRLAPRAVLAELGPAVLVLEVGKAPGQHPVPQESINRMLVEHAAGRAERGPAQGRRPVRLRSWRRGAARLPGRRRRGVGGARRDQCVRRPAGGRDSGHPPEAGPSGHRPGWSRRRWGGQGRLGRAGPLGRDRWS